MTPNDVEQHGGTPQVHPPTVHPPMNRASGKRWLLLFATAAFAQPVGAQSGRGFAPEEERWQHATWVDDMGFAAGNAVLGGLAAGIVRLLQGGDFSEAFVQGALGGAVGYGGKRLAAERFDGAGLLGRSVHAVGASIAANAGGGRGTLEEIMVPLGPLRFHWGASRGLSVKADLPALYWIGYGIAVDRLVFDPGRSLSAGAPVFVTSGADMREVNGSMARGVIFLDSFSRHHLDHVAAHERVHVLQYDMRTSLFSEALEGFFGDLIGGPLPAVQRWVRLGFSDAVFAPWEYLNESLPRSARMNEVEADYLEVRP